MVTGKWRIVTSGFILVVFIIGAIYTSCTKPGPAPLCRNVVCKNEGYCSNGSCVCPFGYEGTHCENQFAAKYLGAWDVVQTIIGSDSVGARGQETKYISYLSPTPTPTTFFIDNFMGNANYNQLLCIIDSIHTNKFVLDTVRDQNMIYGIVYIMPHSNGTIYTEREPINTLPNIRIMAPVYPRIEATFIIRRLTPTHNWRNDTLDIYMTPKR